MRNVDLLKSMDIFAQLAEDDLQKIAGLLREKRVTKDTILFRQGDAGDALYVVLSGRIKYSATDSAGQENILGVFSEGNYFGEMAVLTGEPRPATARAVTDTRMLMLRKDDFDSFLTSNVPVMLQMMKIITQRQAAGGQRPAPAQAPEPAIPPSFAAPPPTYSPKPSMSTGGFGVPTAPFVPPGFTVPADLPPPTGRVFTIFSPKGGVGKSTLAVNLAVALARAHPESVALVDLSLVFGHGMLLLNLEPRSSLASTSAAALRQMNLQEGLSHYLSVHPSSTLRVLAGSMRPEEGEMVSGEVVKVGLEQLCRYFAYVVVDTGSYFWDPILAALEAADKILLICSPEISVVRDMRECQRILNDVVHITRDRILYVMNYLFPFKMLSRQQFESSLEQQIHVELPYGGDVAAKAALRGEAFVETQSGSPLARSIERLAAQLVAETAKAGVVGSIHEKRRGFFR